MFKETITNVSLEMLQSELTICKELLELEPDNKCECEREKKEREREERERAIRNTRQLYLSISGCVLTTLQLLEAVDPLNGHDDILNLFDKLVIVDPYRKGYYSDLSMSWQ